MTADRRRGELLLAIRLIEPPVFLQLPHNEPKNARQKEDIETSHYAGQPASHIRLKQLEHPFAQIFDKGEKDLVCDRHDRKVLDRMQRWFDQQIDINPNQERDERPDHSQKCLCHNRQPALVTVKPQPFIDGIQEAFDKIQHLSERVDDPVNYRHHDARTQLVPCVPDPFCRQFLRVLS